MATSELAAKARDQLGGELRNLASALGERAAHAVTERITGATGRLGEYADQGGGAGLIAAATGAQKLAEGQSPMRAMVQASLAGGKEKVMAALGRGKGAKAGRGGKKLKVTTIVEAIEVGVPVRVAYNQWTTFSDFPTFMKKVEQADLGPDGKMAWKAQVFWSHRSWESTILRQIPDRLIHWQSTGDKGSVDGTVSFHEVGPGLTKILVVLEYHPQGLFERTGNLWRAQGRRVRLELKHFVRHVMTRTVLDPDSVQGWRGEIEDAKVVKDHDAAGREERESREERKSREDRPERDRRRAPQRPASRKQEEEYAEDREPRPEPQQRSGPARRTAESPDGRWSAAGERRRTDDGSDHHRQSAWKRTGAQWQRGRQPR